MAHITAEDFREYINAKTKTGAWKMKQLIFRSASKGIAFPVCKNHAQCYWDECILETDYEGNQCKDCKLEGLILAGNPHEKLACGASIIKSGEYDEIYEVKPC